jgi:hypothetical protein
MRDLGTMVDDEELCEGLVSAIFAFSRSLSPPALLHESPALVHDRVRDATRKLMARIHRQKSIGLAFDSQKSDWVGWLPVVSLSLNMRI